MNDYMTCIKNLGIYSKNSNIFILIHKMDKLKENVKEAVFDKKKRDILNVSEGMSVKQVFGTSIWDETLYKVKNFKVFKKIRVFKAWSSIVQLLIPNREFITSSLKQFCSICDCDEVKKKENFC